MVASHINFPFFLSYRSLNYYYAYDSLVERLDFLASPAKCDLIMTRVF